MGVCQGCWARWEEYDLGDVDRYAAFWWGVSLGLGALGDECGDMLSALVSLVRCTGYDRR